MTKERLLKYFRIQGIFNLKAWKSIKWFFSMLWPDKTLVSRMIYGMAFICIFVSFLNATFTIGYSVSLLNEEMGHSADKELQMAKMICERAKLKTDSATTARMFQMIKDYGIDSKYIICITDTNDNILACNKEQYSRDSIQNNIGESFWGKQFNLSWDNTHIVKFHDAVSICLSDTLSNKHLEVKLIEPLSSTFQNIAVAATKIWHSSLFCIALLVICYLVMFFIIRRTSSRNKQIEGELDVAANIQKQMVPLDFSSFPEKHGYDLHGMLNPAKAMGGDLLDFVLRDNKLFFCIGDVSGKGMPAALFMSQVYVLFHHVLRFSDDPADICSAINRSVAEGNDTNMFCTYFLGIIDFDTNIFHYCNAGHNQPVLIDSEGKAEFMQTVPNIALGLIDTFPFQAQQMAFTPGTTLVTYTDGVTEAESLKKQVFGDDALIAALKGKQQLTPSEIVDYLKSKIDDHTMLAEQSDDITMLVLRYDK